MPDPQKTFIFGVAGIAIKERDISGYLLLKVLNKRRITTKYIYIYIYIYKHTHTHTHTHIHIFFSDNAEFTLMEKEFCKKFFQKIHLFHLKI